MKKIIAVILAAAAVLSLCSCAPKQQADFTIAALKGPTAIGLVNLMEGAENGNYDNTYNVTIYGTADEIVPALTQGTIDIACLPANLASVLYNRTEGELMVAAVNTLGVLYVVENGNSINNVSDLAGKTVYSTGKGTTPEYALNYILSGNGIDPQTGLNIEFKSESSEIAALLMQGNDMITVLPQPYVAAVQAKLPSLRIALSLTDEWNNVSQGESSLVTGVVLVRREFAEQNPQAFADFLSHYAASAQTATQQVEHTAELCEKYSIVTKAVASSAIPLCNIVFLTGEDMRTALEGYLNTLYQSNPQSVGGELPEDDFYYTA